MRTDAEGYRIDESGQRLPDQEPSGAAAAVAASSGGAAAASAPFLRDDDEPDLADAENPFATAEANAADTSTDSAWDDARRGYEGW